MKILLIEDLTEPAQDIISALKSIACDVTWITGVEEVICHTFFDEFDGIAGGCGDNQLLELRDFDIALIDFEIEGNFNGSELVPALRKSGVVCVGISAKANLNGEIMASGAHLTVPKHALADQVRYHQFDVEEIVETYGTDTGIPDEELIRTLISRGEMRVRNAPIATTRQRLY